MSRVLHICNWVGGITTRNVAALKRHSLHSHELVATVDHCYDMATEPAHLTEKNTTMQLVLQLAGEADMLHFHAVGYDGAAGLPGTIHGIDWSQFRGKKPFILHGMVSDLQTDGSWVKRHGERFEVRNLDHYDALMGPHLSCKKTYEERLEYVPDFVPIWDWLYTPCPGPKQKYATTFKDPGVVQTCHALGIDLRIIPTPTKLTLQLEQRRRECRAAYDNATDGHWGLFGIESLAQGTPCVAYTHEINKECWKILGVPEPPFFECEYGGAGTPKLLRMLLSCSDENWQTYSLSARAWVEAFYDPLHLARRWDAVYDEIEKRGKT